MKKFKTLFFTSILFLIAGNTFAQKASLSDYLTSWTGVDKNGNSYAMTLKGDNTATFKKGTNAMDVVAWKLNFDESGEIAYDTKDHVELRLISNINTSGGTAPNQSTLNQNATEVVRKIYFGDVYYNMTNNTLEMKINFHDPLAGNAGSSEVTITFTK